MEVADASVESGMSQGLAHPPIFSCGRQKTRIYGINSHLRLGTIFKKGHHPKPCNSKILFPRHTKGQKGGKGKAGRAKASVLPSDACTHLHIRMCSFWGTQTTYSNLFSEPQHGRWQGMYHVTCENMPGERWEKYDQWLEIPNSIQMWSRIWVNMKIELTFTQDKWSLPNWIKFFSLLSRDFRWREHSQSLLLRMLNGPTTQDRWGASLACGMRYRTSESFTLGWLQRQMSRHGFWVFLDMADWPLNSNVQNPLAGDQIALRI